MRSFRAIGFWTHEHTRGHAVKSLLSQLSKETPPAFLVCGENDRQNISQGLPELYLALKRAGASAELHVYAGVGHGFGMRETTKGAVSEWPVRFYDWLDSSGFLKQK